MELVVVVVVSELVRRVIESLVDVSETVLVVDRRRVRVDGDGDPRRVQTLQIANSSFTNTISLVLSECVRTQLIDVVFNDVWFVFSGNSVS